MARSPRSLAAVTGLLATLACQDEARVEVPADALSVVALTDEAGALVGVQAVTDAHPLVLNVEGAVTAHVFSVPIGELREVDGRPLDPDRLAGVSASAASARPAVGGGCGRCTVPSAEPPWTVAAGDRCPPPARARVASLELGSGAVTSPPEAELEALRAALRIDWPGACACHPAEQLRAPEVESCPLWPRTPAPTLTAFDVAADGWAAGRGSGGLVVVDPQGSTWTQAQADPTVEYEALGAVGGPRFVSTHAAEQDGLNVDAYAWELIEPRGQQLELTPLDAPRLRQTRAQRMIAEGDTLWVLGGDEIGFNRVQPSLHRCRLDRTTLLCTTEELPPDNCGVRVTSESRLVDRLVGEGAEELAVSGQGVVYSRTPGGAWRCDRGLERQVTDRGEQLDVVAAGVEAGQLYLCGHVSRGDVGTDRAVLASAELAPILAGEAPSWRELGLNGRHCEALWPDAGGQLNLLLDENQSARVADLELEPLRRRTRGVDRDVLGVVAAGDWLLLSAHDGSLWRRNGAGTSTVVFGPAAAERRSPVALVSTPDGGLLDLGREQPLRIERRGPGCAGLHTEPLVLDGYPFPRTDLASAAVRDERSPDRYLVGGRGAGGTGWIRTVDLSIGAVVETLELEAPVRRLASLREGLILALVGDALWQLSDDGAAPVATEWAEHLLPTPPTAGSGGATGALLDLDAAGGVGWAVGEDLVVRLRHRREGEITAERFDVGRLDPAFWGSGSYERPAALEAVRALCADQVVVAGQVDRQDGFDGGAGKHPFGFEIQGDLGLTATPSQRVDPSLSALEDREVVAIAGPPDALRVVFRGGQVYRQPILHSIGGLPETQDAATLGDGTLILRRAYGQLIAIIDR